MTEARIILSTIDTAAGGEAIARDLVGSHLASCVNIIPGLRSIYRWQGEIHNDKELLLIIKTNSDKTDSVIERILELHPYDLPEAVVLEIESGYPPYLEWILEGTR